MRLRLWGFRSEPLDRMYVVGSVMDRLCVVGGGGGWAGVFGSGWVGLSRIGGWCDSFDWPRLGCLLVYELVIRIDLCDAGVGCVDGDRSLVGSERVGEFSVNRRVEYSLNGSGWRLGAD